MADVTDQTFQTAVVERSREVPVVVDLWAEWCGPCRTLGPILEKVIAETDGAVELAKIDVDQNPQAAQAFRVQSIPAVFALRDGAVVDHFVGAQPEHAVREFIDRLAPNETEIAIAELIAAGDELSLRKAVELGPAHEGAVVALAGFLIGRGEDGDADEGLALLEKVPETAETKQLAARARLGGPDATSGSDEVTAELDGLLGRVKDDEEARQRYLDLLELLGPTDPRTVDYRRRLTNVLF